MRRFVGADYSGQRGNAKLPDDRRAHSATRRRLRPAVVVVICGASEDGERTLSVRVAIARAFRFFIAALKNVRVGGGSRASPQNSISARARENKKNCARRCRRLLARRSRRRRRRFAL